MNINELNSLPNHALPEPCSLCNGSGTVVDRPGWDDDARIETCPDCAGTGLITRNYLREAFVIAQGRSSMVVERKHLEALVGHCRALVSAAMESPRPKPNARVAEPLRSVLDGIIKGAA